MNELHLLCIYNMYVYIYMCMYVYIYIYIYIYIYTYDMNELHLLFVCIYIIKKLNNNLKI